MLLWENKVLDSPHEQTDNTQTWYLGECISSGKWPEARGREPFIDGPNTIERAIDEAIGAILAYDKQNVMLGAGTICVLTATICDRTGQEIAKLEPTKATVVANNGRRLCDVTYAVVKSTATEEKS